MDNGTNSHECYAYPIVISISNIFVVIAFIAFSVLSELHETLFSKSTVLFTIAHFAAYNCVAIDGFMGKILIQSEAGCKVLAFLTHFFFLNTYSWMTVLAFQIFQTFRCQFHKLFTSRFFMRKFFCTAFLCLQWACNFLL